MKEKTALITDSSQGINEGIVLVKNIVQILSFAVLTGISAGLKLEIGPVPVTAQTLIVLLSGALLGSKKGSLSQLTYLAGGLFGLPWFSRGGGLIYIMSLYPFIAGDILKISLVALILSFNSKRKKAESLSNLETKL